MSYSAAPPVFNAAHLRDLELLALGKLDVVHRGGDNGDVLEAELVQLVCDLLFRCGAVEAPAVEAVDAVDVALVQSTVFAL
jgi:hypothetical protein